MGVGMKKVPVWKCELCQRVSLFCKTRMEINSNWHSFVFAQSVFILTAKDKVTVHKKATKLIYICFNSLM